MDLERVGDLLVTAGSELLLPCIDGRRSTEGCGRDAVGWKVTTEARRGGEVVSVLTPRYCPCVGPDPDSWRAGCCWYTCCEGEYSGICICGCMCALLFCCWDESDMRCMR